MPAPSPPGLKSSIEYLAMSVGIGRTLYGPPKFLVVLAQRYENIELSLSASCSASADNDRGHRRPCRPCPGLADDPLALYLGILVDIIQEWNWYSVFKDFDREPIPGDCSSFLKS